MAEESSEDIEDVNGALTTLSISINEIPSGDLRTTILTILDKIEKYSSTYTNRKVEHLDRLSILIYSILDTRILPHNDNERLLIDEQIRTDLAQKLQYYLIVGVQELPCSMVLSLIYSALLFAVNIPELYGTFLEIIAYFVILMERRDFDVLEAVHAQENIVTLIRYCKPFAKSISGDPPDNEAMLGVYKTACTENHCSSSEHPDISGKKSAQISFLTLARMYMYNM